MSKLRYYSNFLFIYFFLLQSCLFNIRFTPFYDVGTLFELKSRQVGFNGTLFELNSVGEDNVLIKTVTNGLSTFELHSSGNVNMNGLRLKSGGVQVESGGIEVCIVKFIL